MTREEAIREVNKAFDFVDDNDLDAIGFACVVTHVGPGGRPVAATTGMAHTDGLHGFLLAGVAFLLRDARAKLANLAGGVH